MTEAFERSSLRVRLEHERDGHDVNAHNGLPVDAYAAHGGAFPLRVPNVGFVGSVVVSGLPQVQDHELVVGVLEAVPRRTADRTRVAGRARVSRPDASAGAAGTAAGPGAGAGTSSRSRSSCRGRDR